MKRLFSVALAGALLMSALPAVRAEGAAPGALRRPAPFGWREKLWRDLFIICRLTSRLGWGEAGPNPGRLAAGVVERPAVGGAGLFWADGMD